MADDDDDDDEVMMISGDNFRGGGGVTEHVGSGWEETRFPRSNTAMRTGGGGV